MSDKNIDFVLTWVDGSDKNWLSEKEKYQTKESNMFHKDASVSRYRDWDNLRYWFRGVEKFAPWVNKIFFVTWGHVPSWLNINDPKIEIVKHSEFIPEKYLPTFNINAIENNFHRIQGLSEQFVYFNDDMFLINPVKKSDFFIDNKPVDNAVLTAHCYSRKDTLILTPIVDIGVINEHFSFHKVLKDNFYGWFNPIYGKGMLQNIILSSCPRFPGISQHHLPTALLKRTYEEIWKKEEALLDETCLNKFRSITDVNQWLFREWQIASNNFIPRNVKGKSFAISNNNKENVFKYINSSKGKMICINDGKIEDSEFQVIRDEVKTAFDKILGEKSSYEK